MSYANKLGVLFIVLVGEDEIAQGKLSVKNMETGEQQSLSSDEAAKLINEELKKNKTIAPIKG